MKTHLNTLFITLEDAYLRKDGAAVEVRHEKQTKLRVPLHNLDGIATFAWHTTASTALMHACAEADVALSFHNPYGKFLSSSHGPQSGNVLLRRAQYRAADNEAHSLAITHPFLDEKTTLGLLPHLQARLLARHLRGDLDAYPAFLSK